MDFRRRLWFTQPMQLDVESLRTFLAVLDHGGMTSAANYLEMSQSSVSWKIKRLEERVGRSLLIRDGHTIRPSRDGRALVDDARLIVDLHDRAVARLTTSELSGQVRLGATSEVSAARIAAILGRFKRSHPGLDIEFITSDTSRLSVMVDDAEIDVAVIQVSDADLRSDDVVLWTDSLKWATCCETPYEVGAVPLVTYGDDCFYRPLSEPILTEHDIDYTISISVPSTSGTYAAIAAGLGVGVLAEHHLTGDVVEWKRGAALTPLPQIYQVARAVPGEHPATAAALVEAIVAELGAPEAVETRLLIA